MALVALLALFVPASAHAAPVWTLGPTAGTPVASTDVTVSASISDVTTFRNYSRLMLDGGAYSASTVQSADRKTVSVARRFIGLKEGTHTAKVYFQNDSGAMLNTVWSFTVEIPPAITGIASAYDSLTPQITAVVLDPAGIAGTPQMTVDGTAVAASWNASAKTLSWTPSAPFANDSTHTVAVTARDGRGNVASQTWTIETHALPKMSTTDCTICHQGFPTTGHPFETVGCFECHQKAGTLHEWDPNSCLQCHLPHSRAYLAQRPCTSCHAEKVASTHGADKTPAHMSASRGFSGCNACHDRQLHREHVNRTGAGGARMTCADCHASKSAAVSAAVAAGDTRCGSCHSIEGLHADKHVAPVIETCAGAACHSGGLVPVHASVPCDSCHGSDKAAVLAAVAGHDRSCTACHDAVAPHGDLNAIHSASTTAGAPVGVWSNHREAAGWIPSVVISKWVACSTCHTNTNLLRLHGATWDSCGMCHAKGGARSTFPVWEKGCQQGACHVSTTHDVANAQASHVTKNCWSRWGGCHNDNLDQSYCSASCHPRAVTARGDLTPPATTVTASVVPTVVGQRSWYTSDPQLTLSATDGGSGVAAVYFRVNGGAWVETLGSVATTAVAGSGTVEYYAVDRLGNREASKYFDFAVDKEAPVTTAYLYAAPGTVHVRPQDPNGGSGVAARYYSFDGAPFALASSVYWDYLVTNPDASYGPHTLRYYSVDKVGNTEAIKTLTYSVADPAPPTVTFAQVGNESPYFLVTESPNTPSGLDKLYYRFGAGGFYAIDIPVSGSPTSTQRVDLPLSDGNRWIQWYATDKAGNASAWGSRSFRVDVNAPAITIDAVTQADGTVLVTARANDAGSGLLDWQADALWNGESQGTVLSESLGYWQAVLPVPTWGTRTYEVTVVARDNSLQESTLTRYVDVQGPTTPDETPPETIMWDEYSGQQPTAGDDGAGGLIYWGELQSTDLESGVVTISYSLDSGEWVEVPAQFQETDTGGYYWAEFPVTSLGVHTLEYFGVNGYGTAETPKTSIFTVVGP